MKVFSDSCACRSAKIHPEVVAIRMINLTEGFLQQLPQIHHLIGDWLVGVTEPGKVNKRNDQCVPAGVWVQIEDNKIELPPVKDIVRFIRCGPPIFSQAAEDTAFFPIC